jgi:hypothetical protein
MMSKVARSAAVHARRNAACHTVVRSMAGSAESRTQAVRYTIENALRFAVNGSPFAHPPVF